MLWLTWDYLGTNEDNRKKKKNIYTYVPIHTMF